MTTEVQQKLEHAKAVLGDATTSDRGFARYELTRIRAFAATAKLALRYHDQDQSPAENQDASIQVAVGAIGHWLAVFNRDTGHELSAANYQRLVHLAKNLTHYCQRADALQAIEILLTLEEHSLDQNERPF